MRESRSFIYICTRKGEDLKKAKGPHEDDYKYLRGMQLSEGHRVFQPRCRRRRNGCFERVRF